ncbi:MAG: hypothetical protein Q8P18_10995 [Pseudomonadota bacterium]|nr:hypothetical protein [Pseudomonadota bacterium]
MLTDAAQPELGAGRLVAAGGDIDGDGADEMLVVGWGVEYVVPATALTGREVDVGPHEGGDPRGSRRSGQAAEICRLGLAYLYGGS